MIGIIPPSGVKLSCMAFTEPFEASVVATAHRLVGDAEADLLAFHVGGIDAGAAKFALPAPSAQ